MSHGPHNMKDGILQEDREVQSRRVSNQKFVPFLRAFDKCQ